MLVRAAHASGDNSFKSSDVGRGNASHIFAKLPDDPTPGSRLRVSEVSPTFVARVVRVTGRSPHQFSFIHRSSYTHRSGSPSVAQTMRRVADSCDRCVDNTYSLLLARLHLASNLPAGIHLRMDVEIPFPIHKIFLLIRGQRCRSFNRTRNRGGFNCDLWSCVRP